MKQLLIFLWLIFSLSTSVALGFEWDPLEFVSVDEIESDLKAGKEVKGIVKTVFEGTKIEEFPFKVLSVERNFLPQSNLIWALGIGDKVEKTGVVAGMSGSPAYINGRLAGALAYGYSFAKEPIFGVTPIADMLKVFDRGMEPAKHQNVGTSIFPDNPDKLSEHLSSPDKFIESLRTSFDSLYSFNASKAGVVPIGISISISGFTSKTLNFLSPMFEKFNMMPVQGGGGGHVDVDVPLVPGAAVGVDFLRGDYNFFGFGTVTYVKDGKILAFGHPMFAEGNTNLPMSGGYVHYVFSSLLRSFKVGSSTKPIGTLVQDRVSAIAGVLGNAPSFVPLEINLKSKNGERHYKFEMMNHKLITPILALIAGADTIFAAEKESGDYTIHADTLISLKGHPSLSKSDTFSGDFPLAVAFPAASAMSLIMNNPFMDVEIDKVKIDISLEDKRKTANLESVRINKNLVKPGEEVELQISLAPYLGKPVLKTHRLQIPADIPESNYMLIISSALAARAFEISRAPFLFQPKSFDQLLEIIQMGDRSDEIIVELFSPKFGLAVSGSELPNLPLSVLSVMNSPKQSGERGITRGLKLLKDKILTEYVVSGQQILQIRVSENAK